MCSYNRSESHRFFFQAEDGIRDLVRSRGLGDVYKRQVLTHHTNLEPIAFHVRLIHSPPDLSDRTVSGRDYCLLYTSDAADDLLCVDLGGRRIIKKKNTD